MKSQRLRLAFPSFFFFFFWMHADYTVHETLCTVHAMFTRPTTTLFKNIYIKNKSHGTIHTFKNYFVTLFSISNFQFSAK